MMNRKLMMAAMMAATMAEIFPAPRGSRRQMLDDGPLYPTPTPARGTTVADAAAMVKAEAKRQRKAAKRRAEVGAGNTADKRPNVNVTGAEAGSSPERPR